MMFIPAEGESAPFHAEPEEGQVAPELPEGVSNEPEESGEGAEEAPAEGGEAEAEAPSEAESAPEQPEASEASDGAGA